MEDRFNDPRLNVSEHTASDKNHNGSIERESAGKKPAAGEEYHKDTQKAVVFDPLTKLGTRRDQPGFY